MTADAPSRTALVDAFRTQARGCAQAGSPKSAPEQQQPAAQTESPSEPKPEPPAQDPSPPDLPTEPTTAAGDNANPPALATAPKEVLELLDRYYGAFSTGQWELARQCFWDGATFTSVRSPGPGEPVQVLIRPAREVFDEFVSGKRVLESVDGHLAGKPQVLRTGDQVGAWAEWLNLSLRGASLVAAPLALAWLGISLWLGRQQSRRAQRAADEAE